MLKLTDSHDTSTMEQSREFDLTRHTADAQKMCFLFLLILDEIKARYKNKSQEKALKKLKNSIRPTIEKQRKVPIQSLNKSLQSLSDKTIVVKHRAKIETALVKIFLQVQIAFNRLKKPDQQALCRHRVQWTLINKVVPRNDDSYLNLEYLFRELTKKASDKFRSDIHGRVRWAIKDAQDQEWHDRR